MAAAPGSPGAPDPRDAPYWETVGKLLRQREQTTGENRRVLGTEQAGATRKQGLLSEAEPGTYAANRYRGVREGIASSGVNTERRGGIAKNYADRRFAVQHALTEREGSLSRSNAQAEGRYNEGVAGATTAALERARLQAEREAAPPPTPAYNPGGERTVTGPPGPGGVVPYEEKAPGTFVRVGAAKPIQWSRDPAVRRLQAQRGY